MKKILFITHEASRTGAPFVLLYFMKWMKAHHPEIRADVLLLNGGGLAEEFRKVAHQTFDRSALFSKFRKSIPYYLYRINHVANLTDSPETHFEKALLKDLADENYNIIYANTVLSIPVASAVKAINKNKPQLIAHIHELEAMIEMALESFDYYAPTVDTFIAVSHGVKNNLVTCRRIPAAKIDVIYEFSVADSAEINSETASDKPRFEVGGAGSVQIRKGFDIFIQTAFHIKKKAPEAAILFRWVGDVPSSYKQLIETDLKKTELNDRVIFEGASVNPHSFFKNFDVFLLSSREDPFPLVCIEAGMLGKPVICFDKGNGTAEVLKAGGGKLIPYLDTEAMADAILNYYNHPETKKKDGEKAKELFSEFIPEKICPQIYSLFRML
ncbi:MAG: glycosyltransferase [Bacteroidota bacterium]|nr:glycosyltransferase [Bacteroidota bacterium]